tara:strand:- start:1064 stop:3100 length:2037 start_codon:yes stop_codon:yes gene_type:complete
MNKHVISDQLSHALDNQHVIASVFTTYNFEPDFFELDVIPLLLNRQIPFSSDERVKTFQVREALRESMLEVEVFYDLPIFRQSAERSPEMEYYCHGVNRGNNAFHAKNIYLLVMDKTTEQKRLLVAAGSNNLSRAGWWENIEVQHWEVLENGDVQRAFINRLKEDIAWLIENRATKIRSSLDSIQMFLNTLKGRNDAPAVNYYGPSNTQNFFSYLNKCSVGTLDNYQNWTLEIISPFFAENTKNQIHMEFISRFGVNKIIMLLPQDQDGAALCNQEYYQHIKDSQNITWGAWNQKIISSLGLSNDLFRRVHAKIYHFYNGVQSWVFVGSVNFSHKAIYDNVESGFFSKIGNIEPLLEPIAQDLVIDSFCPPTDLESSMVRDDNALELPELHLSFDWRLQSLQGRTVPDKEYEIEILNSERILVVGPWLIKPDEAHYEGSIEAIKKLLTQGSLITIRGKSLISNKQFPEHKVMLQQIGWSHKPIDLPSLSPEQILAIYAGMTAERRELLLMNAHIKQLVLKNLSGEITANDFEVNNEQFFCEYAEVFHAFRMFKKRLINSLEKKEMTQVDYYLTGSGMDSLPALILRACDQEADKYNAVTSYLLLLSIKELYQTESFVNRLNVHLELERVKQAITNLKLSDTIVLDGNSKQKREKFFKWFEDQFSKEYVSKPDVEAISE